MTWRLLLIGVVLMSKRSKYREGFVTVGGYRMHYLEWGESGDQVVVLHSMGIDAHGFDFFSEPMSRNYHLLAIDLLGHGDSDAPKGPVGVEEHTEIVRSVALEREFKKSVLIGHSIGGMISMIYAAKYPKEVEKVILVDIAPRDVSAPPRPSAPPMQPPESFPNEEEALKYLKGRYAKFGEEMLQNRLKYAFKQGADGRLRLKSGPESLAMLRSSISVDLWPFVSKMTAPTLLLVGSESQTVSRAAVEKMQGLLKKLEVVTIEGATHLVPQDKPKDFEKAVKKFLRRRGK